MTDPELEAARQWLEKNLSDWNQYEFAELCSYLAAYHAEQSRALDGKFSIRGSEIVNTVSGEVVPKDEPLFLLRARDVYALAAIDAYQTATEGNTNELHQAGIQQVRQKFCQFAAEHPERMKEPGKTRHLKLEEDRHDAD